MRYDRPGQSLNHQRTRYYFHVKPSFSAKISDRGPRDLDLLLILQIRVKPPLMKFRLFYRTRYHINSGYTVRDRPLGVVRRPLGNVELLTLTRSCPCNRKRYNSRNFHFFDSQSTVNSQQSTSTDGATGIDIRGAPSTLLLFLARVDRPDDRCL